MSGQRPYFYSSQGPAPQARRQRGPSPLIGRKYPPRTPSPVPSARQLRILQFIRDFMREHQGAPTMRDIMEGCALSSTSVVDYNLRHLDRLGFVTWDSKGRVRRLRLVVKEGDPCPFCGGPRCST